MCLLTISSPKRSRLGRPPRISDASVIALAVGQVFLDCPNERRFLRFARARFGHLFPYVPGQSGYNKRVRSLAPQICLLVNLLARRSPSFCLTRLRLLDSTLGSLRPVAGDGQTVRPGRLRRLRLLRLALPLLLGVPALPRLLPRRDAARLLPRPRQRGRTRGCRSAARPDAPTAPCKGTSSSSATKASPAPSSNRSSASSPPGFLRPDRKDESYRHGDLGGIRQWIESIIETTKGKLSLERHGGRTLQGVWARICQRVLALAIGVWNNWQLGQPGRSFTAYDH